MAGRTASNAITRYPGIQVQTSALGMNIPVGWGTFRCNCNLVDYLDFKSSAQKAAAGKGGATTTGYNYSATVILAVCEGPIDAITQVWVNGKQYAHGSVGSSMADTGSTIATTQAGLSMSLGTIGQTPWSYLVSKHPDHAIGYSGLVLAFAENYALDSSASTPNHSFEVVRTTGFAVGGGYAGPDGDPSLIVADFFENTRTGVPSWTPGLLGGLTQYQAYCLAAGLLVSPVIDQQRSASDFVTELLRATNATCVWSEGLLKFIPYGDTALTGNGKTYTPNLTPVYALDDDDFVVQDSGEAPLNIDIEDQSDAYNVVQLEYLDRTNQYNMAIALASDAANVAQYGMRRKDPDTVHCVCTPSVAAISSQLYLQRTLYVRAQYKFDLSWAFALLEPGDIVEISDAGVGLSAYPIRIIQIDEDEKGVLSVTGEDLLVGVSHAPLYTMQTSVGTQLNQNVDPGGVEANLLLWSQDLTNAAWINTALTITAGATTNPVTGASDAQKAIPTVVSSTHVARQSTSNVFPDAAYTLEGYFKAAGDHLVRLSMTDATTGDEVYLDADLTTGSVVTPAAGALAGSVIGAAVTSAGGSWWRITLTGVLPSATSLLARFYVLNTAFAGPSSSLPNWNGNGSDGVFAWGFNLSQGIVTRPYAETTTSISGPQIFNPPVALTPAGVAMWAAAAGGANWGGANVWVSFDGVTYEQVGQINGSSRFGVATASFASGSDPDTTHTLSVDLTPSGRSLTSAAQAVADASGTLCLVDAELVSFTTVTPTAGSDRYDLSTYIRRGVLGAAIAAHSAGAPFIRLDDAIFEFPYLATQAGQTVSVKFQSFNLWGNAVQDLATCVAYAAVPIPAGARAPASTAWTAVATTITNGGASTPAIKITGASDNLSATQIEFFYRPTGTSQWIPAGLTSNSATQFIIAPVQSMQTYDVAVAYIVGGVLGALQIITSGGATTGGGGSGGAAGTALLNDSVPGTGKTFTIPAGFTGAHVDIVLTGFPGSGSGVGTGKGSFTNAGGGGANVVVVKGFPAVAGDVFTYTLPAAVGSDATVTKSGLSLVAHPGANASATTPGTGGANAGAQTATGSASVTSYAGHNGGLTDTWDGGGPGAVIDIPSGAVTNPGPDNAADFTAGAIPGQGGAGSFNAAQPGGGCNLLIIART